MRFRSLRVFVDDLAAAHHFYGTVLGLKIIWEWQEAAIGFDLGIDLIIELVGQDEASEDRALVGRFIGASIEVCDIVATYKELTEKGVTFIGSPERQAWGGLLAHFQDPSGNLLTLCQS